jgi:hypothetical protein
MAASLLTCGAVTALTLYYRAKPGARDVDSDLSGEV